MLFYLCTCFMFKISQYRVIIISMKFAFRVYTYFGTRLLMNLCHSLSLAICRHQTRDHRGAYLCHHHFNNEGVIRNSLFNRPPSMHAELSPGWSVAMETSDKHCQTQCFAESRRGMYDETVEVDGREVESPEDSEAEDKAMAKFNPPTRHTARHDFDSDTDSDISPDKSKQNLSEDDKSLDFKIDPKDNTNPKGKKEVSRQSSKQMDSYGSDTDSDDVGVDRVDPLLAHLGSGRKKGGVVIPAEGAYDPKLYQDLKVPPDLDNLFQYIMKYTPQKIDIEFRLQPFVPEYVPAVGDADALIKVTTPAAGLRGPDAPLSDTVLEFIDNLGLTVLDEPASEQSDSALLHLQLRAISKTNSAKSTVLTRKVENAEKNPKAIDRWIKDVSELHMSKPAPTVTYTNKMPDIDSLMEEWPETMEDTLNEVGFPPANIDCTLSQYVDLVCGIFDIPVHGNTLNDRIQALHLLFSLYSAVKSSQLYSDREKEKNA